MKLVYSHKKGVTSAEVVRRLISENPCISAIHVFFYSHPPLLQERLKLSPTEQRIAANALALREKSHLPFWEALLLACFTKRQNVSRLVEAATFHQTHQKAMQRLPRNDVISGRFTRLTNSAPSGQHLSWSSKLEIAGTGTRHLPMLDFHCAECAENDRLVVYACRGLFRSSALVFSSGESYHAVGLEILSVLGLRRFLHHSLLLAPIVDCRYVAHQLIEGACALRLSSSMVKPTKPRLKFICER